METLETARMGLIVAFALLGLFFSFVSMTGVLRLPDVYSRAHTASQADTLGAGFGLAAVALAIGWEAAGGQERAPPLLHLRDESDGGPRDRPCRLRGGDRAVDRGG